MLHVPTSFPGFSLTRPYGARGTKGRGTSRRETWQRVCVAFTFADFSDCLSAIGRFHSPGWQPCKFIATKERVNIRKEFNSHRTGLRDQDGGRDVTGKGSIGCSTHNRRMGTTVNRKGFWEHMRGQEVVFLDRMVSNHKPVITCFPFKWSEKSMGHSSHRVEKHLYESSVEHVPSFTHLSAMFLQFLKHLYSIFLPHHSFFFQQTP